MNQYIDINPEEEEEMIRKVTDVIKKYGMEVVANIFLGSLKPLVFVGGQMGRIFIFPFLPAFGDNTWEDGEKFFTIFEKRENVEKLIQLLEKNEKEPPKGKAEASGEETTATESEDARPKKGWRRFLPF